MHSDSKEYHREWYRKNKDRVRQEKQASAARRRAKILAVVNEAKNKPCVDCGIKYPPYVMDFDHLSDKEFSIGAVKYSLSMKRLTEEISKCEVVCSNCHRERTHSRSIEE